MNTNTYIFSLWHPKMLGFFFFNKMQFDVFKIVSIQFSWVSLITSLVLLLKPLAHKMFLSFKKNSEDLLFEDKLKQGNKS